MSVTRTTVTIPIAAAADDKNPHKFDASAYPGSLSTISNVTHDQGNVVRAWRAFYGAGNGYQVYSGCMRWDTSAIPANATITSAYLEAYVEERFSQGGFARTTPWKLTLDWHSWNPAAPVASDYAFTPGTSAHPGMAWWMIQAGRVARIHLMNPNANINKSGYTGLRVHMAGNTPTGSNWITFTSYEGNQAAPSKPVPKLVISYEVPPKNKKAIGTKAGVYPARYLLGSYHVGDNNTTLMDAKRAQIGSELKVWHRFADWDQWPNFSYGTNAQDTDQRGMIRMMTTQPETWNRPSGTPRAQQPAYALSTIVAGNHDARIDALANEIKNYGKPMILRPMQEMNYGFDQNSFPWAVGVNGNTAQHFIDAWQRIYNRFQSVGATNARFHWCPGQVTNNAPVRYDQIYPGDDYVHYAGFDAYNDTAWGGWWTWAEIAHEAYDSIRALTAKPIIIGEMGCSEGTPSGTAKAQWITDTFFGGVQARTPEIVGFVWFDEDYRPFDLGDYRIDSSPAVLTSYKAVAAHRDYQRRV